MSNLHSLVPSVYSPALVARGHNLHIIHIPLCSYGQLLYLLSDRTSNLKFLTRDAALLRFFHSFLSTAPQVTVQLYAVTVATNPDTATFDLTTIIKVTLIASAVSLLYTIMVFSTSDHLSGKNRRVVFPGHVMLMVANVSLIVSRVFALALFAHAYGAFVFVVVGIHLVAVFIGILHQQSAFCADVTQTPAKPRWYLEVPFNVLASFVYIFIYLNLKSGRMRYQIMVFHILTFVENVVMVSLFYTNQSQLWYAPAALAGVIGLYLLGLLLTAVYYAIFHPNKTADYYWIGIPKGWCRNGDFELENRNRNKRGREVVITSPTLLTVNGDVPGFQTSSGLRIQNQTSPSTPPVSGNGSGLGMRPENAASSSGTELSRSRHGSGTEEEMASQEDPQTHARAIAGRVVFDISPSPSPLPTPIIEDAKQQVAARTEVRNRSHHAVTDPREPSGSVPGDIPPESSRSHPSDPMPEVGSHRTDTLQSNTTTTRSDIARSSSDGPTRSLAGSSPSPERRDLGFPFVFQDIPAKKRNYLSQRTRLEEHYFPDSMRQDRTAAADPTGRTLSLPDGYHSTSQPAQLSAPETFQHVSPSHHRSPVRGGADCTHLSQGAEPMTPHTPILKRNHSGTGYAHRSPERVGGVQASLANPNPDMLPERLRRNRDGFRPVRSQSERVQMYQMQQNYSPERHRRAASYRAGGAGLPKPTIQVQVDRSRWDRWSAERGQPGLNPRQQDSLEPNRNVNLLDPTSVSSDHVRIASWSGDQPHDRSGKGFQRNARSHSPERNRGQRTYGLNLDAAAVETNGGKAAYSKGATSQAVNLLQAAAIAGPTSPKRSNLANQTEQASSCTGGTRIDDHHHGDPDPRPRVFSDSSERLSAAVPDQNGTESSLPPRSQNISLQKHSRSFHGGSSHGYAARPGANQADRSPETRARHFASHHPHDPRHPSTRTPLRHNASVGTGRPHSGRRPNEQQYSHSQEVGRTGQAPANARTNPHSQYWRHNPLQEPTARTPGSLHAPVAQNSPKQSRASPRRQVQGPRISPRERDGNHGNQMRPNPLLRMPTVHAPVSQV